MTRDGLRWGRVVADSQPGSPPGRVLHAMAFDEARGVMVLTAGASLAAGRPMVFGDTWEWNGIRWRRADVDGPAGRDHAAMAYDPARRAVVLHGGGSPATGPMGDTWAYNGKAWSKLAGGGPVRARHRLVYDRDLKAILLFGGYSPAPRNHRTNEMWRFGRNGWVELPRQAP